MLNKLGALTLGLTLAIAGTAGADDAPLPNDINYAEHIAPILYQNCTECHRPGQIGPMSLLNYEEARPWAKSIKQTVVDKEMPPWDAHPEHGNFGNDPSLSAEEIAKIVAWVDRGAPAGDLSKAPASPVYEDAWRMGEPDAVFQMQETFMVPDEINDMYKNFLVPCNLETEMTIESIEIRAGNPSLVHHVLVFILPEGMDTLEMGGSTLARTTFLTGWAPGTPPMKYPEGFGMKIPPRCNLLFQLHYHKEPGPGSGGPDQSMLAVKWHKGEPKHNVTLAWVMDPGIRIPPGAENYQSVSSFKFVDDGYILSFVPHMHLRGKDFRFEALYPDGTRETLLWVPDYDFNWQLTYELAEPLEIPKNTMIIATAHYDNSANNPSNPDPTQTVYFSEKTTDEMMIGFMGYAYKSKPKMQAKYGLPEEMGGMGGMMGRARRFRDKEQEIENNID